MAKKKVPSVDDAIKIFKDAMQRASLSDYLYVNKTLFSTNPKGNSIVIIPEQELWMKMIDDPDLKDHMKELNPEIPQDYEKLQLIQYTADLDADTWIDVDTDVLFKGKLFRISVKGFEYELPINKGLLPLKLRKAEYNNISYRVFTKPNVVLSLKKRFDFPSVDECGFTMIRMFQVI